MKVAILNDLPPFAGVGSGAELSIEQMMKEGWRRGHTVTAFTNETMKDLTGFDLIVLKNVVSLGDRIFGLKERIVNWPSDYTFCKWRLFYKQAAVCQRCIQVKKYESLFQMCELNIFLSPLHKRAYEHVFENMQESIYIPSPIDVEKFKPVPEIQRTTGIAVAVNSLLPFKGINNILSFAAAHPEMKFLFYGAKADVPFRMPLNAEYRGMIPNDQLPQIYSQFEFFVHLPETPMPFERTVAEAYLCGCKLIVNPLVGATSYDWWSDRDSVRKHVGEAAGTIWNELEARL